MNETRIRLESFQPPLINNFILSDLSSNADKRGMRVHERLRREV